MLIKMKEGEILIVRHEESDEGFVVLEAKWNSILNRTDSSREQILKGVVKDEIKKRD